MDLEKIFNYHAPKEGQPAKYELIRNRLKEVAYLIKETTPASAEQTLSIRKIEEAMFYANAAVARNE